MDIKEYTTQDVDIDKIKIDGDNPNQMSEKQFEALKKTMATYGYLVPVILDKNFKIADGEHRFLAYKELGRKTIPAIVLDIDDPDRRILRQIMNKLKGTHDKLLDLEEFQKIDDIGKIGELKELLPEEDIDKPI